MAALHDLPDLSARLSAALAVAHVPHAVSGALAMAAFGFVRATRDIDLLVVVPSLRLPEAFAILRRFGFAGEDRDLVASLRDRYVAEMTSGPATVNLLVPVLPYHRTLLDRAITMDAGGGPVPFVSPDDLVVLKMLWRRTKDVADVHALLSARANSIDWAYLRPTLSSFLPDADPRHAEIAALERRLRPS